MQFSNTIAFFALMAFSTAAIIETPVQGAIRRDVLLQERAGANANRPVASGNCCVPNTSLKEDVCTTATGKAGLCLPLGASFNCNGALNCIDKSTVKCNPNVLENGRPTCR
ncbi:hypothetical protein ACMFMG_003944 [Clarireedia jacksonii]